MPRRGLPSEGVGELVDVLQRQQQRLRTLEVPTGEQLSRTLAKVQQLIADLPGMVSAAILALVNLTISGNLSVGGNASVTGTTTSSGGVTSTGVYNNLLTSAYRAQWINSAGSMGYVPSSRRFKRDIETAPDALEAALAIRVVTFRYMQAVDDIGPNADIEWGVIAEEIHDLGLTWAVDYDENGVPLGVRYDRLVLAVIPVMADHESRLRQLEGQ